MGVLGEGWALSPDGSTAQATGFNPTYVIVDDSAWTPLLETDERGDVFLYMDTTMGRLPGDASLIRREGFLAATQWVEGTRFLSSVSRSTTKQASTRRWREPEPPTWSRDSES